MLVTIHYTIQGTLDIGKAKKMRLQDMPILGSFDMDAVPQAGDIIGFDNGDGVTQAGQVLVRGFYFRQGQGSICTADVGMLFPPGTNVPDNT